MSGEVETANEAFSQNDVGQLIGYSRIGYKGGYGYTATVWNADGTAVNIGGGPSDSYLFTFGYGINNVGQAVGNTVDIVSRNTFATLWDNGTTFNLNDLVSNSILGNWYLEIATGINDNGWIVGEMYNRNGGESVTFLLTPDAPSAVPLPAAVWLFGSALGGFGLMRRRKA